VLVGFESSELRGLLNTDFAGALLHTMMLLGAVEGCGKVLYA
jgi:hypothetical protein